MERSNVSKAILGGFVATLVMTMMMYVTPMMGMPKMDIAAILGSMMSKTMPAPMSGPWLMGMMLHFINGTIIFPLIFFFLLFRILPGAPWLKGVTWGLILLAQLMVMPMMGMGIFSGNAPNAMMSMGSLMRHIIYGAILGGVANGATELVMHKERPA